MELLGTIAGWLLVATLVAATLAVISRLTLWGTSGWLAYRLDTEQARAVRLQAQAQIEAARARERATVAAAEAQARAQVLVAHVKAATPAPPVRGHAPGATVTMPPPSPHGRAAGVMPTPPDNATLPDVVHWQDIAGQVRPGYFAYGMLPDGRLLQRPITTAYHVLLHGETRSGKTTAIHSLLVQAHTLARVTDVRCYMVDVKRELGAAWGRSPLLQAPVQHDIAGAAEVIAVLVRGEDGVLARYARFEELAHRRNVICANLRDYERHHPDGARGRPPLVFVVIDELNALLELARKHDNVHRNLTVLLQTGAGAGFYVIAGAQYLTAKTLGRDATQQFVSRAHFGSPDPIALHMLFNQPPQLVSATTLPPGRGMIRLHGQPHASRFQGVYCDEQTILEVQRRVGAGKKRRGVAEHPVPISLDDYRRKTASPGEHAARETPAETEPVSRSSHDVSMPFPCDPAVSAPAGIDPEKAAKVAAMSSGNGGNITKRQIIAEVWGATTGRRYIAASAEYEAIMRQIDAGTLTCSA